MSAINFSRIRSLGSKKASRKVRRREMGRIEFLESREMMAADAGHVSPSLLVPTTGTSSALFAPLSVSSVSLATAVSASTSDNTLATARNLGTVQGVRTFSDSVGPSDTNDYYRFVLDEQGEVMLRLDQLAADADLYLYNSAGQEITRSWLSGRSTEQIVRTLGAGTYFARVTPYGSAQTGYRLTLDVDIAGETTATALNLGTLSGSRTFTDWVGPADTNDYFRFVLNQRSGVTLRLDQMTADADLFLYNSSGQEVARSYLGGTSNEQILQTLNSGTYFARVAPYGTAQTNYRLTISTGTVTPPVTNPFPNVPNYGGANDWNLNTVNVPEVWAQGYTGSGVIVAVLDSGVDYTHSDLAGNMWVNSREIPGNGRDDDGNGFVDDYRGWDFVNRDNNPMDRNGHGTHVAGTIAALRNGTGATGVAYNARIMPIQVLDGPANGDAFGSNSGIAAGIRYAVNNGAHIINASLGGSYSSEIASALQYAYQRGVFVVIASGNESAGVPAYPARHAAELSNVISVGAHTSNNVRASFSNRVGNSGAVQVDAPGQGVYSSIPGNRYATFNGTSMAAPHVAGIAALALSANRSLTPTQLRQVIVSSANRAIAGSDSVGGVNAALTVPLAIGLRGSASAAVAGSSMASTVAASSPRTERVAGLATAAAIDGALADSSPVSAHSLVGNSTTRANSNTAARLAVFETWNSGSQQDDASALFAGTISPASSESAWDDWSADLLEAVLA